MHAGQHHVAAAGSQSRQSGQLLGRPVQTGILGRREREARECQRPAHDDADMQSRDRQQMRQAGGAERLVVRRRNAGRDPGEQSDRHRAGSTGHHRRDVLGDRLTQALHQAERTSRRRFGDPLHRTQRVAGAALSAEPGIALQVPGARIGGRHRRTDQRAQADRVAGRDRLRVALLQPYPNPALQFVAAVQLHRFQSNASSVGKLLHGADCAGQDGRMPRQHWPGQRARGGELRCGEADGRCRKAHCDGTQHVVAPQQQHAAGGRDRNRDSQPQRRLHAQREIAKHAGAHEHRQPWRETSPFSRLPAVQPCHDRLLHMRDVNAAASTAGECAC